MQPPTNHQPTTNQPPTNHQPRVGEFNAQSIANTTAWAFATLGQLDEMTRTALARAAAVPVSGYTAHWVANTAWAFATLGQRDEKLFSLLDSSLD